jgi:predicted nucleic acid-binding protein
VRVFFDTNVLISVLISGGKASFLAFETVAESQRHNLVTCTLVIEELTAKMESKFRIAPTDPLLVDFLDELDEHEIIQTPQNPMAINITGLNDTRILTAAVMAGSDIFLTGDKELLALKSIRKMRIMQPGQFLEFIKNITAEH